MKARMLALSWLIGSVLLLGMSQHGIASETRSHFAFQQANRSPEPEQTASVNLGTLSVRRSPMHRSWNPRVCIGCERNNAPSPDRGRHQ